MAVATRGMGSRSLTKENPAVSLEEGGRLRPAAEWLRETEEDLRGFGGVLRSEL